MCITLVSGLLTDVCVVLLVSSTMAWHCIVYSLYSITMWYPCVVVLWPQSLYPYEEFSTDSEWVASGQWVRWMSTERMNMHRSSGTKQRSTYVV